eukprot:5258746-Pleurochrysis_carterae.AAC.1
MQHFIISVSSLKVVRKRTWKRRMTQKRVGQPFARPVVRPLIARPIDRPPRAGRPSGRLQYIHSMHISINHHAYTGYSISHVLRRGTAIFVPSYLSKTRQPQIGNSLLRTFSPSD